jgi:hypothetical protein
MTELQTCPNCGGRVKFSRIHQVGSSTSKRRDCPKCGHADTVLIQEIYRIVEVAKRAKKLPRRFRMRKAQPPQTTKPRKNRK